MAKGKGKPDTRQMSLFDVVQKATRMEEKPTEGQANVRDKLRISMNQALKETKLSRHQVAGEMSHLLGVPITIYQMDAWTAESKNGHRMPAEYLPAFCVATGSRTPLAILSEAAGAFCLPGPDAIRADIQRLDEEERKIRAEKKKRKAFLSEMETGK